MSEVPCTVEGCDRTFVHERAMTIHRARVHLGRYGQKDPPASEPTVGISDSSTSAPEVSQEVAQETVPRSHRPSIWDRIKGRKIKPAKPLPTGERAPKRGGKRRVPLDTDITDIWGFLGRRLETTPHYPTGRMLQYQAPASGLILDRAVAGTLPDRLIFQPLARGRDKWEDAAFLLAGPLVTFGITRSLQEMELARQSGEMETYATLQKRLELQREGFEWLIRMMLPRLAEGKKRAEEKRAKEDAAIADAFPELAGTGIDPVTQLVDMLFASPISEGRTEDEGTGTAAAQAPGEGVMAQ